MKFTKGIYILLGSNLGDRIQVLHHAKKMIQQRAGDILQSSAIYETEPWGVSDQPSFYNQVLKIQTSLDPHCLLEKLQGVEQDIGKVKLGKWRERLIDVDILYYHDLILDDVNLTIPHPEIGNRRFTLVPLCELAANSFNRVLQKNQQEMLNECRDELAVWPLTQVNSMDPQ